jgi:hypothetical protein
MEILNDMKTTLEKLPILITETTDTSYTYKYLTAIAYKAIKLKY